MNRNFKKVMALVLAVLTLASCFSTVSFAATNYPGHENHLTIVVPAVAATTCKDGSTEGVKCLACEDTYKRVVWIVEPQVLKAPHAPSDWAVKGTVTDCTLGYQMEKKCTKCQLVLETKTIVEHSYANDRTDQPYCDVVGTVYKTCSVCGDKVTQPAEVREHVWKNWETQVVGTCTLDGVETRRCSNCFRVEEKVNKAPGHKYTIIDGSSKVPTCKEEGSTAKKVCNNCGDVIPGTTLAKKSHVDSDKDNYCDMCELYITDDMPEGCDCPCHEKSGIRKVLFDIAIFFLSLFKIGATCGCGAVHYEARDLF